MAVAKQVLKISKARGKTVKTTKKKRGKRAEKRHKGPKEEETTPQDGAERLRQAVDRRLGRNSEKLADLMEAKALEGDLATTKAMVGFAEGKKPVEKPEMKRVGLTHAEQWAREPQWQGRDEEGSRE
jgi:hypothetical protein